MAVSLQTRTALSWWQRFLFGMALPLLAYYGAYVLFQERVHAVLQTFTLPAGRAAARGDVAQVLRAYAPLLAVVVSLPLWMFTLGFMLRSWRHRSTAFVGGILAIGGGLACTWFAMIFVIRLLR